MKYIKPPDFQSVKEFQEFYKKIETDITRLLVADGSARTANELQEKLKQALEAATIYLARKNENYVRDELPKAFDEGKNLAKGTTKLSAKEANEILEKQGFKYAKNAFKSDTYIELQTAVKGAGNGLKKRVNDIIKDLHKDGKDTIYNVQQAILKDLQQNGILTVEYSNGAKQTLTSYAAMAARSARIESQNIGAIGRALQNGTDYVKMTFVPQCCKLCGAYQDKVYCISGKDKRFPALFKTVLKSGYALPHPNCRHEFIPYYLDMESDEDIQKAISKSKIKYDSKGNLIDVRYQKDIKAYAEWQAGNRQLNAENKEFAQMQAYYKSKGETSPYTTLAGFRRARRANSEHYKESRDEWDKKKEKSTSMQKPPTKNFGNVNNSKESTHIYVLNNLGKAESALKKRFEVKSASVIITDKQFERHIAKGANTHDDIYEKVKDDIPNILEDPDFVFVSDKREDSVIYVSVLHKVQLIVKLNVESKEKSNTIITIFGCGEKTLKRLKKKNEILYRKGIDK